MLGKARGQSVKLKHRHASRVSGTVLVQTPNLSPRFKHKTTVNNNETGESRGNNSASLITTDLGSNTKHNSSSLTSLLVIAMSCKKIEYRTKDIKQSVDMFEYRT